MTDRPTMDRTGNRAVPERPVLTCPSCAQRLTPRESELSCPNCAETVPVVDGIPHFPAPTDDSTAPSFFDLISPIYETPLWFPTMYRLIGGPTAPVNDRAKIAKLLDSGGDVLDVACGTGRFTRYIASGSEFVWGIDLSEDMLTRANRYAERAGFENVTFARMDVESLQFETDAFDRVACCWALHLFPDVSGALREIRRVLKPDGRFAGATLTDSYVLALPGMQEAARHTLDARVFEQVELQKRLKEADFPRTRFERRGGALFFSAST